MNPTSSVLLYTAHPAITAFTPETSVASGSRRTRVLDDIRADVDRAQKLALAGSHQEAVEVYHAVRNRIFRLLVPGAPGVLAGVRDRFAAPHDLAHLNEMVRASATLLADLVPGTPEAPVIQSTIDAGKLGDYRDAARVLPRAGTAETPAFAGTAALAQASFDAGDYTTAREQYLAAAKQAANDPVARASLHLNAGAAAVQAGKLADAGRSFDEAMRGFQEAKDPLGSAQVAHNLAILSATGGDVSGAEGAFKDTDERTRVAAGSVGTALEVLRTLGRANGSTAAGGPRASSAAAVSSAAIAENGSLIADLDVDMERASSDELQTVLGHGAKLILRDPLVATAWSGRPLSGDVEQRDRGVTYSAGLVIGSQIRAVTWQKATVPSVQSLIAAGYQSRLSATTHLDLRGCVLSAVDLSVQLAHLYYYVIPVGLADAYIALGDWVVARQWLLRAANYPYLNPTLEAPALWLRIARTHLGQGDSLYKADEFAEALSAYGGVVAANGGPGGGPLFTHTALAPTGALVGALLGDPATLPPGLDAALGAVVLDIAAKVRQLVDGLDWFGLPADLVPPFTFDYLQNAARFLAQQAQAAERDFMQFMERYDSGQLTRLQLDQAAAAAVADEAVAVQQSVAAQEEVDLASTARALADLRHSNAEDAREAYEDMSTEQIRLETEIAWYSSQNSWELNNPIPGDGRDIHEVIAADRARLGEISQDYELLRMQQNIGELALAEQQANAQVALSQARAQAAALAASAATLRRQQAAELAAAFESNFFTPEVWKQLADFMRAQAQRYLYWATRVARLMERAYEFDYDATVNRIRTDYSAGVVNGMLGSDQLLADVDYFTYDRITRTTHKTLRASLRVSLAEKFPFAFATSFRRKGEIQFNTLLADLERDYPGSYNHRIQAVEVEVVGLVPAGGLRGTLANSGVSQYRALDGGVKWRLQNIDTMLLSAYGRDDGVLFRPRPELLTVFEGVGMASGWTLKFPSHVNDVDFRFIVDVAVTFHFEAQFDRALAATIDALPTPPEALRASTSFSLANDFPDRFFLWRGQGSGTLAVGPEYLPHHHVAPVVRTVSLQLLRGAGPLPSIPLTVTAPGGASADVTPDGDGRVPSTDPALAALVGAYVQGDWTLATTVDGDDRSAVHDILLFVEYDYTERGAA